MTGAFRDRERNLDESDFEIVVISSDASELIDEDERKENECLDNKELKESKRHQSFWIKSNLPHYTKSETQAKSTAYDLLKQMETASKD
ncbi:hypothetical protein TNCT_338701 [Trichonephila clavata]|uniref:Uncharacterized protein n=1 Tax=Trichonephila clavata TaxID=2740835 RepID=A0A8X6FL75_TRICU|nr:hypothetical protein TNCT_338701 [Trichonephila clavata]